MKNACIKSLLDLGGKDNRIVLISVDQYTGFDEDLKSILKERFIFESISEANVVGMASGLAAEGYVPYIFNHSTFNTRRCYEQIFLDSCLQDRPVRLIGMGGGLATAHLGPTHTSIEDISIMRAIPNMTIIAPCDAEETTRLMPLTLDWPQTIYIRLAKYGKPIVSSDENGFKIGKGILIKNSGLTKDNILLVTTGAMTHRVLAATEELSKKKIESSVLHLHTIKPLDREALVKEAMKARLVVTIEEHILMGGLGSACIEVLIEEIGTKSCPEIQRIALPNQFIHNYGDQDTLMEKFGLQPNHLVEKIQSIIKHLN